MAATRQTAFKLRIHEIKNSQYIKDIGEWDPNYIVFNGNRISRINVIATIVMKNKNQDNTYVSITLDDGTESIRIKSWREDTRILENVDIGDIVMVIGRVREFNEEKYITPEIVKIIPYEWALVRKIEMEKMYGELKVNESYRKGIETEDPNSLKVIEERIDNISPIPIESQRQTILGLVDKYDTEDGADMLKVISNSKINEYEANKIIEELIKEGEIFQTSPGKLKLIN